MSSHIHGNRSIPPDDTQVEPAAPNVSTCVDRSHGSRVSAFLVSIGRALLDGLATPQRTPWTVARPGALILHLRAGRTDQTTDGDGDQADLMHAPSRRAERTWDR